MVIIGFPSGDLCVVAQSDNSRPDLGQMGIFALLAVVNFRGHFFIAARNASGYRPSSSAGEK
jgi:hypothetical protein